MRNNYDLERHTREVEATRGLYLRRLLWLLIPLLILLSLALLGLFFMSLADLSNCVHFWIFGLMATDKCEINETALNFGSLIILLAGGALGSLLAFTFKFRDSLARMSEFGSKWRIVRTQAVIGACSALIIFLALKLGFVALPGANLENLSGVGFPCRNPRVFRASSFRYCRARRRNGRQVARGGPISLSRDPLRCTTTLSLSGFPAQDKRMAKNVLAS